MGRTWPTVLPGVALMVEGLCFGFANGSGISVNGRPKGLGNLQAKLGGIGVGFRTTGRNVDWLAALLGVVEDVGGVGVASWRDGHYPSRPALQALVGSSSQGNLWLPEVGT